MQLKVDHEFSVSGVWYALNGTYDPEGFDPLENVEITGPDESGAPATAIYAALSYKLEEALAPVVAERNRTDEYEERVIAAEARRDADREEGR